MECYRRYPMTGPVALELHFRAARKTPPTVQRAAKHTLDILGAALPGCERPRRRRVMYHDDRQVKFLYAGLDQSWTRNSGEDGRPGSVFIVARRASDVITDLCMAGRLSREHYDEDEDSPFWTPDLPDDPEPGWPLTNPSTPEERYLAEAFRFDYISDLQEAILARTNASLITGLSMYLEGLAEADPPEQLAAIFEESQASSRNLLLSAPFTLPLPALPRATGEAEDFARLIRDRLEEFRSRLPLFRPISVGSFVRTTWHPYINDLLCQESWDFDESLPSIHSRTVQQKQAPGSGAKKSASRSSAPRCGGYECRIHST